MPAVGCHEKYQNERESRELEGGNKKPLSNTKDAVYTEPEDLRYCN